MTHGWDGDAWMYGEGQRKKRKPGDVPRTIGYNNPPRHRQFKKGQSGNPKGRPKKKPPDEQSLLDCIEMALAEPIEIQENGKKKKIAKKEVLAKQFVNNALKGDKKSIDTIRQIQKETGKKGSKEKDAPKAGGVLIIPEGIPHTWEMFAEVQQMPYRERWPEELKPVFQQYLQKCVAEFYLRHQDKLQRVPLPGK